MTMLNVGCVGCCGKQTVSHIPIPTELAYQNGIGVVTDVDDLMVAVAMLSHGETTEAVTGVVEIWQSMNNSRHPSNMDTIRPWKSVLIREVS